jgi:hypothetical protein
MVDRLPQFGDSAFANFAPPRSDTLVSLGSETSRSLRSCQQVQSILRANSITVFVQGEKLQTGEEFGKKA